ncbi:gamma-glutamyl-gamma-aminobutyrate hydrolase family protein [Rhodococcus wratislaviensis]|uniref:gamma-glutamyl-gamma-aminobutyrate hydrolase family protein n=1 Tax=Rhodococcus wratislaviensis TaxID=44752 RepID=UPI003660B182
MGIDPRWAASQADLYWSEFGTKISEAGGLPVQLPYESDGYDIIDRIDGLIVTGGQDIDPELWGGPPPLESEYGEVLSIDRRRDDYEISLIRCALDRNVPILGVCRGNQVLNVALGGTMIPDLPDQGVRHLSLESVPDARPEKEHQVTFAADSLAASLYGATAFVNSWHHQAVDRPGAGLVITGRAEDGVVESIELPGRPLLGVQWHPEASPEMEPCFPWLIDASREVTAHQSFRVAHA